MTNTREIQYVCTPFFCRRNVIGLYPDNEFAESPIIIPAEHYDYFAVIMRCIIEDYTLFDDRCLSFEEWLEFLALAEEYLSSASYQELLMRSEELPPLKFWLRINGSIFWEHIDDYRRILSEILSWTTENVLCGCVNIKGI